jgi:ABC-type proline/glycine betaine transport system permease subunit
VPQCSLALSFHQRSVLRGKPVRLLKVRQRTVCQLKQCVHVQGVLEAELCMHMFISVLGVLNVEELTVHVFIFVHNVLKTEKLCVHVFTFVRGVAKLCLLVFVCTGRSESR